MILANKSSNKKSICKPKVLSNDGTPVDTSSWLLCNEGFVPGISGALRRVTFLKLVAGPAMLCIVENGVNMYKITQSLILININLTICVLILIIYIKFI